MIDPTPKEPPTGGMLIGGIVLAAGRGARFAASAPKTLALFRGEPLVRHACRAMLGAGVHQVVVVVGYHGDAVVDAIGSLEPSGRGSMEVVENPGWQSGLSTSVIAGLARLLPSIDAALLMPADQPLLHAGALRSLIEVFRTANKPIVAAADQAGRVRGAPALFARSHFPCLARLAGDRGARDILRQAGHEVATVTLGEDVLRDIDTLADLQAAQATAPRPSD